MKYLLTDGLNKIFGTEPGRITVLHVVFFLILLMQIDVSNTKF